MEKQYIDIMIQSLQKKVKILAQIAEKNEEQTQLLKQSPMSWDSFDGNADEKLALIGELEKLDDGFESLYEKVKDILQSKTGQQAYADEIIQMQGLISAITEKSISIQAMEARNKQLVEQYFKQSRDKIKTGRNASKAAMDYYRNMRQTSYMQPQFLDHKK